MASSTAAIGAVEGGEGDGQGRSGRDWEGPGRGLGGVGQGWNGGVWDARGAPGMEHFGGKVLVQRGAPGCAIGAAGEDSWSCLGRGEGVGSSGSKDPAGAAGMDLAVVAGMAPAGGAG